MKPLPSPNAANLSPRIVPAEEQPVRDVSTVIREFRAYSQEQARTLGKLSIREIKAMTEEGRP